jgi:multidrug efflux system membrane fusion protein
MSLAKLHKSKWLLILSTFFISACTPSEPSDESIPAFKSNVSVLAAQTVNVPLFEELQGRVVAYRTAEIRPQVNGIVEQRLFKQGDVLQKSAPLFQLNKHRFIIDVKDKEAALKQSQANLALIESQLKRLKALGKSEAVSKQSYEEAIFNQQKASAKVLQDQAKLEKSHLELEYTRITAPISGVIGAALVTEGALVTANNNQPLAVINQIDRVYIDVRQPLSTLSKFKSLVNEDQRKDKNKVSGISNVSIINPENNKNPINGKIVFSGVNVDVNTGDLIIRIVADNVDHVLLPGMYVNTQIPTKCIEAVLIPQQAVMRSPNGQPYVMVVNKNVEAERRNVVIGERVKNQYAISSGINDGDSVIISGQGNIMPGAQLNISKWQG